MHLSKLRCVELLTAVIQCWLWKSGGGLGRGSVAYLSGMLVFFLFAPSPASLVPPVFFIISASESLSVCLPHLSRCNHQTLYTPLTTIFNLLSILSLSLTLVLSHFHTSLQTAPFCSTFLLCLLQPCVLTSFSLFYSLIHSFLLNSLHSFVTIIFFFRTYAFPKCHYVFSTLYHYYYHYIALSLWVSLYLSLCFLSYAAGVLCCFYSTHSPPIFIPQRTNTTTSLCLSFSPLPFLALPVSPLSNSLSKWDCS